MWGERPWVPPVSHHTARPGKGLGSPRHFEESAPPGHTETPESCRGPEPMATRVSRSQKPCPPALNPLPNIHTPPGPGGGFSAEAPGQLSGSSPWVGSGQRAGQGRGRRPEAAAPSVRPSPHPGPFLHSPQRPLTLLRTLSPVQLLLESRRCHLSQQKMSLPARPHPLLPWFFYTRLTVTLAATPGRTWGEHCHPNT